MSSANRQKASLLMKWATRRSSYCRRNATATLAELRFDSIAGWLSQDEAAALRAEFHRELDRLYALLSPSDAA